MATYKITPLPAPGKGRFWVVKHQPNKRATPVRVELRQSTLSHDREPLVSFSTLVNFEDTIADAAKIYEAGELVLVRASKVDEFVGMFT